MNCVKRKVISVLLLLTMLLSLVAMPSVYASEKWDGGVATSFAGGTGTQADPYLISNGNELMYLAALVDEGTTYEDKKIKLRTNITK